MDSDIIKDWYNASSNDGSSCVDVRMRKDGVDTRNSKDPEGPQVSYTKEEWAAFIEGAKSGKFDVLA